MIISLYAGGMTLRGIQHHLASTIGTEISHEMISKIVDQIGEEILIWQQRPLEALYPVIFLDAIVVKVRDGGHVRNKAAHLVIGIDVEGIACAGHLGAGERGHDVLGGRLRRARQPRRAGRTDRLLRWPHRLPRSGRGDLAGSDCANLRGPPDPRRDVVRLPPPTARPSPPR